MRTTYLRLGAIASSILLVISAMGSASAQSSKTDLGSFAAESKSEIRMQLCFGGAVAGFAALMLLRRQRSYE